MVAQKPLLRDSSRLAVTFCACAIGAAACLPFAPALVAQAGDARAAPLAWAVYLGVFPTAIAFTTWAYALRHSTAGRTGAMTYFVPPVVVLLGWLVLGEVPPAGAVAGGVLCLAGAAWAQGVRLPGRRRRVPAPHLRRPRSRVPPLPVPMRPDAAARRRRADVPSLAVHLRPDQTARLRRAHAPA